MREDCIYYNHTFKEEENLDTNTRKVKVILDISSIRN